MSKVAIVGTGCAFPRAFDPPALAALVRSGAEVLAPLDPVSSWGRVPGAPASPDEVATAVGADMTGFDEAFDPTGFAMSAREVAALEQASRWALHAARQALGTLDGGPASLVLGQLAYPSRALADRCVERWADAPARPLPQLRGAVADLVRGLGLGGPAFALDAACASSLVAVAMGVDRLRRGDADLVLAGGLQGADPLGLYVGFSALRALSPSGRSRPFHPEADGLIPCPGAGFVALMRWDDAERAGVPVLAVIEGVGLGNDGRGPGLLVPDAEGQVRAMTAAWADADRDPSDATLVQCHATGTSIGDATELESLRRVFGHAGDVPLTSVKGTLGHPMTAAGMAGLIEVVSALTDGVRPPTRGAAKLPRLEPPLRVVAEPEPWSSPRVAAISAFGFGGNNAHLVIAEPSTATRGSVAELAPTPVHVVGVSVLAGDVVEHQAAALLAAWERGAGTRIDEVELDAAETGTPPQDLLEALPQQLVLLATALRVAPCIRDLPAGRTGVWVGTRVDPEAARYSLRWRTSSVDPALPDGRGGSRTPDRWREPPSASHAHGSLPNVVANRLSRVFDLAGPSITVIADEASGHVAFDAAVRALQRGDVDAAVVGAVDLACDPVLPTASEGVPPGDAAVVLCLRRDAEAGAILATCADAPGDWVLHTDAEGGPLVARFGHAPAATGLLSVALAVAACATGRCEGATASVAPRVGPARAVHLTAPTVRPDRASLPVTSPTLPLLIRGHLDPVRRRIGDPTYEIPEPPPPVAASPPPVASTGGVDLAAVRALAASHAALAEVHGRALRALGEGYGATLELVRATLRGPVHADPGPPPDPDAPRGPQFSREELERLAGGRLADVFGPHFAEIDAYDVQVRMPMPPLLLADRVLGIVGEPLSGGTGRIWTETDVTADAWYLHRGRMPAGLMVEAGQADLLLVSWLGVDRELRGARRYRLLGCQLRAHGPLPEVGQTLRFDIHVDGHAMLGDVRLFFFHYDAYVDGELRFTLRDGQAGFFTPRELDETGGLLLDDHGLGPTPAASMDAPPLRPRVRSLGTEDVSALIGGDLSPFGGAYARTGSHVASPAPPGGRLRLIDDVPVLDPGGGPAGRGRLVARLALAPDAWFFDCHFLGDPCMPGSLMFEGCLQAMAIYLMALGTTVHRDGWRFEPVPETDLRLRCRAQATPASREVTYEILVDELPLGEQPTLFAHVIGSVDGVRAFACRRMGLRLVPGWPLDASALPQLHDVDPVASLEGFRFDRRATLAHARGRLDDALGPVLPSPDCGRAYPRLPGAPYHFVTRVETVQAQAGSRAPGGQVVAAYEVPPGAWYLAEDGAMPLAVLLEVGLQVCGWLAVYVCPPDPVTDDLRFRNLGGTLTVHRDVTADAGVLHTEARLDDLSDAGETTLLTFEVRIRGRDGVVAELRTQFGFFPAASLATPVGLPASEMDAALRQAGGTPIDVADRLPDGPLRLLDAVTQHWREGGTAGRGRLRAVRHIRPTDWYFRSHFFQDPVQPGSLGLQAMLEGLALTQPGGQGLRLAKGRPMSWSYRGQVVPESQHVTVVADVDEVGPDVVAGSASLWVDGVRIYEATGLTTSCTPAPTTRLRERDVVPFWRSVCGAEGPWPGEDLARALFRFVRHVHVHPAAEAQVGQPSLFLANHQVGVESAVGAMVLSGRFQSVVTTLAKKEHRESWPAALARYLGAWPGLEPTSTLWFVDREDPRSLLAFADAARGWVETGQSILVHVEGTRSRQAGDPVETVSALFLDFAQEVGMAVVPLWFSGGLPRTPVEQRLDFPLGMAAQDLIVGAPITSEGLVAQPLKERTRHVVDAINDLTPPGEDAHPADPAFARAVTEWQRLRADPVEKAPDFRAVLLAALAELVDPSEPTQRLLSCIRGARPPSGDTPEDAALRALYAWLTGPRA